MRRLYCASGSLGYAERIIQTWQSAAWIVRWWGFYNMFQIALHSARENRDLFSAYFDAFAEELFAPKEPMGLKHRQCILVDRLLDEAEHYETFKTSLCMSLRNRATHSFMKNTNYDDREFVKAYEATTGTADLQVYPRDTWVLCGRFYDRVR